MMLPAMLETKGRFGFGPFVLDLAACRLWRGGEAVALPPKVYDLLVAMVTQHGRMLTKEDLLKAVWPDTFVEENNLSVNISTLRKVLGEGFIETVPKRGYRFTAPVEELSSAGPELVVPAPRASPKKLL
jgi:DNA-binding winged helix-turn-helix (wHTH) protein